MSSAAASNGERPGLALEGAGVERGGRWLVRHVDLQVAPSSLLCLVGPNGSGKTTTLRLLCGLWQPSEGQALLDHQDLQSLSRRAVARRIAFVPQQQRPEFDFSVRELVAMGRYPYQGRLTLGRRSRADEELIEASLEQTDVKHLARRSVTTLSGGELRRVLIARCLAARPEILLLDEPTANLDLAHGLEVLELCRHLVSEGTSIVIALHDLNAARRYAEKVALFDQGRLVAHGPPDGVLNEKRIAQVFAVEAQRISFEGHDLMVFDRPTHQDGAPDTRISDTTATDTRR